MASQFFLLKTAIENNIMQQLKVFRYRQNPLDAYSYTEFNARYRYTRLMCMEFFNKLKRLALDQLIDHMLYLRQLR